MFTFDAKTIGIIILFIILPLLGYWIGTTYGPFSTLRVTNEVIVVPDSETPSPSAEVTQETIKTYRLEASLLPTDTADEMAVPQTELLLITTAGSDTTSTSLGIKEGTCTVNTIMNIYEPVAGLIESPDVIVDQVSCWFAGAGSETYLYEKTFLPSMYEVVSFETGECGDLPASECSPYGDVEILATGLTLE